MTRRRRSTSSGFSLVELLTALAIFLIICAVAFTLLTSAMKRYQSESQNLNTFQEARFGLDQMVRDINDSGYPPENQFEVLPSDPDEYASTPVAWSPGYSTSAPCQIGVTCITPGDFDVILETKVDPLNASATVQWIRYQLQGNTLYRAVVNKDSSGDPDGTTSAQLVPYVQNVVNNDTSQIAQFQALYPSMFPGGNPVPIFTYFCDVSGGSGSAPVTCSAAGGDNSPENVRSVSITLIVMTPFADAQTGQPRLMELRAQGRRINPNQ